MCFNETFSVAVLNICKKEVNLSQSSYLPIFLKNCDRFGATH